MRLLTFCSAAAFALMCSAAPAFAQGKPAPPAPAPAQQQDALQQARLHFAAGVNLLRDPAKPRYEEAYREFKVAYQLSPAAQILGNLGLCAMMLERDSEAIEAYENYIKGMIEIAPAEREQLDRDLQTLKLGVARVTFTSNVPETTILDRRIPTQGDSINNVYGPLTATVPFPVGIRQGHHIITARAPGKQEIVWEVDATAGDLGVHPFEFPEDKVAVAPAQPSQIVYAPPPPPPERPIPKSFWYGAGATGILGIATVVTGIVATSTASSYESANDGTNPERADELRSRTLGLNVTTDVLLIGTIVAAAFTGYVYLTRPEKERAPATTAFLRGFIR
ncbi:MAG: hypothetical protein KIT84_28505 [Labilithrix sp.]|nr:hypothetical protein [Labilithrix sp.]MCW5815001.1 hypothetical protein [Labilithrix sp.]